MQRGTWSEMYARESSQRRHIMSVSQKYTCRRRREKNHIEEYNMPAAGWDTIANARGKLNWSGQSLIRFMESYHDKKGRGNAHQNRNKEKMEAERRKKKKNHTRLSSHHLGFDHLEKTFTTPSPPPLTTQRPSRLQTTAQTPSPRINRWLVNS
jgi:hypothetical protein